MLGIGFLLRGYSSPVFGIDINALYIPHGIMAGAGLVALIQIIFLMRGKKDDAHDERAAAEKAHAAKHGVEMPEHKDEQIGRTIGIGSIGFALISVLIAFGSGMYHHMSVGWLIAFMFYAAFAAFVHEMIVGLAAMHSGWFPAFAVALITLLVGILIGFPPEALAMLCGFAAATGPAFADMGYDLKAGWILRGNGKNPAFELDGRRQQFLAASGCRFCLSGLLLAGTCTAGCQGVYRRYSGWRIFRHCEVTADLGHPRRPHSVYRRSVSSNGRAAGHWPSYQQSDGWLGRFDRSGHSYRCA